MECFCHYDFSRDALLRKRDRLNKLKMFLFFNLTLQLFVVHALLGDLLGQVVLQRDVLNLDVVVGLALKTTPDE